MINMSPFTYLPPSPLLNPLPHDEMVLRCFIRSPSELFSETLLGHIIYCDKRAGTFIRGKEEMKIGIEWKRICGNAIVRGLIPKWIFGITI